MKNKLQTLNNKQREALKLLTKSTKKTKCNIKLTDICNGEYTFLISSGSAGCWATIKEDGSVIF